MLFFEIRDTYYLFGESVLPIENWTRIIITIDEVMTGWWFLFKWNKQGNLRKVVTSWSHDGAYDKGLISSMYVGRVHGCNSRYRESVGGLYLGSSFSAYIIERKNVIITKIKIGKKYWVYCEYFRKIFRKH